jgi:exopolyphosphatase/guanosine-5'-triphosphate,3'-diphosphate pyrophosphatase
MTDKINVIDLGSSSVRMCCISNGNVLFKKSIVTRLAENKANGLLDKISMERTADAVVDFYKEAKDLGGQIYIFATAAVRNALNGRDFAGRLQELTGERVEILSGEQEAEIGILGALRGKDGALIDIGGGSTEIIVSRGGKIVYEKSLQLGAVNLKILPLICKWQKKS